MDIEKTIQFLVENAAAHDIRLDRLERAVLGLTEHQGFLQSSLEQTQSLVLETQKQMLAMEKQMIAIQQQFLQTQKSLHELGEKTDQRIASLVSAIAKLAERGPNGTTRH
jgi:predicted  nucleic acid-binding Zn-ribbon protein